MEVFKITFGRILSYWVWPLIGLIVILGISYYVTPDFSILTQKIWLIAFSFLFLFWAIPTTILFFNHYLYFKDTVFEYDILSREFYLSKVSDSFIFKKSEIIAITQFSARTGRIPWSDIYVWEIQVKERVVVLAPIVISKNNFIRLF